MTNNIYTMKDWAAAGSFNAAPGQEIEPAIYEQMLNCMPPKSIPSGKAAQALQDYNIPVHAGFLMGEPHSSDKEGQQLYLAFGMNDYGKGKHYYYLGLSITEPELHGCYYFFDCMNAFLNKYFEATAFKDDAEAISMAANHEAILYKYTFEHGERVATATLYDPWACFDE